MDEIGSPKNPVVSIQCQEVSYWLALRDLFEAWTEDGAGESHGKRTYGKHKARWRLAEKARRARDSTRACRTAIQFNGAPFNGAPYKMV